MNVPYHIAAVKAEIRELEKIAGALWRHLRDLAPGEARNIAREQLGHVTRRLTTAAAELDQLAGKRADLAAIESPAAITFYGITRHA